jgi:hypothetical protein
MILAGWLAAYVVFRQMLKRSSAKLRNELRTQIESLTSIAATAERMPPIHVAAPAAPELAAKGVGHAAAPMAARTPRSSEAHLDEITPEAMARIAQAVSEHLGANARVRSVRMLRAPGSNGSLWTQHGRVAVQTSHNVMQGRSL